MIERALDVLKREMEAMPAQEPNLFAVQRAVDFLLQFGDRIHNKKEEEVLFPLMVERGVPADGPIRVMLSEHESERDILATLFSDIPLVPEMNMKERQRVKQAGMDYIDIRANHIWKENDVLFKIGLKVLSATDGQTLLQAFENINTEFYGPDAQQKFGQMLAEVEKGRKVTQSLVHNLSQDQIHAILETLPVEITFVDADDIVAYFNRLDKEKVFVRTRSVIGRKVQKCHPEKSVDQVQRIVAGFKSGTLDKAEFWIDFKGDKILIRYFPVHAEDGRYMGVLEVTQEIGEIQKLTGEKRLLDS
ncbi:MAG: DUF438 domain-containing protein [Desulfobacterales bacterium]|nr:MAG: DUF438 domain-containing protein [Desulfobacterales bacterium]